MPWKFIEIEKKNIWNLKGTCSKTKEKGINRKISAFDVNYGIYFTRETGYFHIYTRASHLWKFKDLCLTREIHSIFNVKSILYINALNKHLSHIYSHILGILPTGQMFHIPHFVFVRHVTWKAFLSTRTSKSNVMFAIANF